MTLVKVTGGNLHGVDGKLIAVGTEMSLPDSTAELWRKAGLVEFISEQSFEVATPAGTRKSSRKTRGEG